MIGLTKYIENILEKRGAVSGKNSWNKIVDYIYKNKAIFKNKDIFIDDPKILSPWMYSVSIISPDNASGELYYAAYRDDLSEVIDGKMKIVIEVLDINTIKKGLLDHELQHAFDDWIAKARRNKPLIDDSQYKLETGYEDKKEESAPNSCTYTKKANCNDFFYMFKWCTYFFNNTEVNAFSREFDRYLSYKRYKKYEINMDKYVTELNDYNGSGPMVMLNTLYDILRYIDKYIEDSEHVDWDYIAAGIQLGWSKKYLGKNIYGKDSKDSVIKTIQYIIDNKAKYAFEKFRKILENHMMKGMTVYDFPWWWKK